MIQRAKFQNFKALRDVEITFDSRLTVLVGPNGSGKTSVLRAISLLGQVASGRPANDVLMGENSPNFTRSGDLSNPQIIEAAANLSAGREVVVRVVVADSANGKNRSWKVASEATLVVDGQPQQLKNPQSAPDSALRSVSLLQLDPKKIAAPSSITQIPPSTASDGSGSASTLAYLHRREKEKFKQAVDSLKHVIPNVVDLQVDYEPAGGSARDSLLFDFQGAPQVRASGASTGTLLVVGLFSVLFGPNSPTVVLLDDLDYALHPKGQMELVELLHRILDQFPELQIIATAHSPYILDKLKPNEVRVMVLKDDGSAACARLEDHPKYPMWKDSMSPGEFWSYAGEDWVKQLVPQTAIS